LKSLQEVPDAISLGVDVESPLGQVEVASLEIYGFERAITFDQIVGSPSNLYRSFRMPFSLE
jgi:hypothetical protein